MDFTLDHGTWQTNAAFQAWSGFTSADTVPITFAPEGRNDSPLSDAEIGLIQTAINDHATQVPVLLGAVLAAYPQFQQHFQDDYGPEETLPDIATRNELSSVIALREVFVHQLQTGGAPYIGFRFHCEWDPEHGLGVLMHGLRVVDMGGADTAFLLWIAEQDWDGKGQTKV
ncbi:DUF6985 domain-containing protein [Pseudooceanicola sp. MF1-13]|uniref:DUF6985 domain-containing protein n=1 Tax=Pseudooceanicola sp. MF1-13 TaxID=3379095 RepID=UPI00389296C0